MSEVKEKETKELSRRKFLLGAGASLAGVALAGGLGGLLTGCDSSASTASAATWPVEFPELDPDKAAEKGYNAYKEQGG